MSDKTHILLCRRVTSSTRKSPPASLAILRLTLPPSALSKSPERVDRMFDTGHVRVQVKETHKASIELEPMQYSGERFLRLVTRSVVYTRVWS